MVEVPPQRFRIRIFKRAVERMTDAVQPVMAVGELVRDIHLWTRPPLTILVILVYAWAAWHGCLLSVMFALAAAAMGRHWLAQQLGWRATADGARGEKPDSVGDDDESSDGALAGLKDRYNTLVDVASKLQAGLETAADVLEKLTNLVTFRAPTYSARVFGVLTACACLAAILPTDTMHLILAFSVGVHFFIYAPICAKFPAFRARYDDPPILERLPTNVDLQVMAALEAADSTASSEDGPAFEAPQDDSRPLPTASSEIGTSELAALRTGFALPPSEQLVLKQVAARLHVSKPWQGGRGTLYVFESFVAFEQSSSNLLGIGKRRGADRFVAAFPLESLLAVEETKAYAWLPGKGFCLKLVFDISHALQSGSVSGARGGGVLSPLLGMMGSIQAIETLKLLANTGTSLNGRLLLVDAQSMQIREMTLKQDPACPVCHDNENS